MRRITGVVALAAAALALSGAADAAVREKNLRQHVRYLAQDGLEGREAGEPGVAKAEEYIAAAFAEYGLSPLPGRTSFLVPFNLYRAGFSQEETSLDLFSTDGSFEAAAGKDFRPFPFSDEGEVEGPVVFAGYGISAPDLEYDDYAELDVSGKLVFVFRHEPQEKDPNSSFDGTETTEHATFRAKADLARKNGARGMILVTDPLNHEDSDDFRMRGGLRLSPPQDEDRLRPAGNGESIFLTGPERTEAEEEEEQPFLAVQVSREMADAIIASTGRTLTEIQTALDAGEPAASMDLGEVRASLRVRRVPAAEVVRGRNVVGWIEGRDPDLREEIIFIGAHHDHVGAYHGDGDTVFNGADDNASGTSAVLEMARNFASVQYRPLRSVMFGTFSAEEKGLLGSRALVTQDMIPVERIVFMLNLDMIGRNPERPVQIFGDGYVRGLKDLVASANAGIGLNLDFAGDGYAGNSDHDSFYRRDIPFMFPFTGTHEDYHQLGDHANKLSYDRMRDITRLAYRIVDEVANATARPRFIYNISWLGLKVEVEDRGYGLQAWVTDVQEDSRAAKTGFRTGDALRGFGEDRLEDPDTVGQAFRSIEPGSRVEMAVLREGGELTFEVERARPGYMGVFPGDPTEEQRKAAGLHGEEGLLLRQVLEGGPSAEAGLQTGDIVLTMAGRPVSTRSLRNVLSQIGAGETVEVLVYRDGERLTLELTLGERGRRRG